MPCRYIYILRLLLLLLYHKYKYILYFKYISSPSIQPNIRRDVGIASVKSIWVQFFLLFTDMSHLKYFITYKYYYNDDSNSLSLTVLCVIVISMSANYFHNRDMNKQNKKNTSKYKILSQGCTGALLITRDFVVEKSLTYAVYVAGWV